MSLRVGIGLFTGQVAPGGPRGFTQEYAETLDLVRLAETLGFDSAWVSEHHGAGDGYLPSLLPMLAAFAAATDRIALGTGVVLTPMHDPLRLAEDAAVVDLLSGGRLLLGLGLAWRQEEFRMFGVPLAERVRRTEETVEVLRRAWTGERFSFEGRAFRFERVQVRPAPERPGGGGVPIWLGGMVEASIRRAARLGDGWVRTGGIGDVARVRADVARLDEEARAAGRGPRAIGFAQLQNAFAWEEGDAWDVVRDGLAHATGVYAGWAQEGDTPGHGFVLPPPDEERLRARTPVGTPAEVAHALRPFVEAFGGAERDVHLVVRLHYPGMSFETSSRAMEVFATHVLPSLKGA
jgi:probable F420-dependent oxidoreductase